MTQYAFPPAEIPSLAIKDRHERFPVRRVWCVGRNYLAHVRELGNDEREPPFFFSKQPDMVVPNGGIIHYPSLTHNFHFELELVVALKSAGENLSVAEALELIFGFAVGLDMTRRDLQKQMQEKGKPWEIGKSFEQSAPVGTLTPISKPLDQGRICLTVNGAIKQDSDLNKMIWNVPEIISRLSQQVRLGAGDLIFTGTPEGVGAVSRGDQLHGSITSLIDLEVRVV